MTSLSQPHAGDLAHHEAGHILIEEGEPLDYIFVILSGEVAVYLPAELDRESEVSLATLHSRECFGEYSFIDRRAASASVKCMTPCHLLVLSHASLKQHLDANPATGSVVYRNLLESLVQRLRDNNAELDLFRFSIDVTP